MSFLFKPSTRRVMLGAFILAGAAFIGGFVLLLALAAFA